MSATVEVRPALMGHLKELRLPTVRECYEETARRAEREMQRDSRWGIVDLVGKHGPVRTVPMPTWVKVAIDAGISAGPHASRPGAIALNAVRCWRGLFCLSITRIRS